MDLKLHAILLKNTRVKTWTTTLTDCISRSLSSNCKNTMSKLALTSLELWTKKRRNYLRKSSIKSWFQTFTVFRWMMRRVRLLLSLPTLRDLTSIITWSMQKFSFHGLHLSKTRLLLSVMSNHLNIWIFLQFKVRKQWLPCQISSITRMSSLKLSPMNFRDSPNTTRATSRFTLKSKLEKCESFRNQRCSQCHRFM